MKTPLKVLMLTPRLPYPPNDGGAIVMFNTLKSLKENGARNTLVALNTRKHYLPPADFPPVADQVFATEVDLTPTPVGALASIATSGVPYNIRRFYDETHAQLIAEVLAKNEFDLIQLEGAYLAQYLPILRNGSKAKIVLRAHNVEYRIWERMSHYESNPLKSWYFGHLAKGGERFERKIFPQLDGIVAITEQDAKEIRDLNFNGALTVIPAGTDIAVAPLPVRPDGRTIGFLGSLEWLPNVQGLRWFLDEIWPKILEKMPDVRLEIAGKNPPPEMADWRAPNMTLRGQVENAAAFRSSLDIEIIPLLSGSGMRVKLAEALAIGQCVVSTRIGAEGVPVTNDRDAKIADTPDAFAAAVVELLKNPERRAKMQANGLAFARELYAWPRITEQFLNFYRRIGCAF